ncbi:MAG: hypothetical protein L0206_22100 [Actinobacteria bacterium]|nr:hypothetical protein [Actinomycetota bacterium]
MQEQTQAAPEAVSPVSPLGVAWEVARDELRDLRAELAAEAQSWGQDYDEEATDEDGDDDQAEREQEIARLAAEVVTARRAETEARRAYYLSDEPCPYRLRDPEGGVEEEIEAFSDKDARRQAREWIRQGYYGEVTSTIWCDVEITDLLGREERISVDVDPEEPDCAMGHDHEWCSPIELVGGIADNPGCWGNGGGVLIHEVCCHCGTHRHTDTWAQRPDTGEQGLESVHYEDADDVSAAWAHTHAAREALGCDGKVAAAQAVIDTYRYLLDDGPRPDLDGIPERAAEVCDYLRRVHAACWQERRAVRLALTLAVRQAQRDDGVHVRDVATYVAEVLL